MASSSSAATAGKQQTPNVVRLCGYSESSCGYCQGKRSHIVRKTPDDSSKSYGLLVDNISPADYETLMNQGWRRSGLHLYKPDNWNSCCPALSIRLEAKCFRISKSQKRVLRSMERCLGTVDSHSPHRKGSRVLNRTETLVQQSGVLEYLQQLTNEALSRIEKIDPSLCRFKFQPSKRQKPNNEAVVFTTACAAVAGRSKGRLKRDDLSGEVVKFISHQCTAKWPFSVGLVRVFEHESSGQVLVTLQAPEEENTTMTNASFREENMEDAIKQPQDDMEEWLRSMGEKSARPPFKLKITTLPAEESALQPEVHKLYAIYQHEVHGDPDPFSSTVTQQRHDYGDEDEDDDWDAAGLKAAARMLDREYRGNKTASQMQRIQKSYLSFYRFLVESPLSSKGSQRKPVGTPPGTYHQHYRVEGQLIAVGVVDVLPTGLSSVYAFYQPSISKYLALGKLAILKEIEWTQQAGLPYYYLGYYIESCTKMKYKADYKPSELLCPTHNRWVDADKATEVLLRDSPVKHCCTLYEGDVDGKKVKSGARVETVRLDVGAASTVTLGQLNPHGQAVVRPLLEEFIEAMGPEVSQRCIIKLV